MNKYILLITSVLLMYITEANAQVTVGSLNKPEDFSALQIEGTTGGLRLPQLLNSDKVNLGTLGTAAQGLIIYNKTSQLLEYWDGTKWTSLFEMKVLNGLTRSNLGKITLGGSLLYSTSLNINSHKLNIISNQVNSIFSVNTDVLVAKKQELTFKPTIFSVSTNDFITNASGITIKALTATSPQNDKLAVNNSEIKYTGKLTYKDGRQGAGKVLTAKDEKGTANWSDLRPKSKVVSSSIVTTSQSIGTSNTVVSGSNLELTRGKWMIIAGVGAYTSTATTRYLWVSLWDVADNTNPVTAMGVNFDTNRYALSQLVFLVNITKERAQYNVKAKTAASNVKLLSSTTELNNYGRPYFYAILVDEPID